MLDLKNPKELQNWLGSNGIDTKDWGNGTNKSIKDLWNELKSGESKLQTVSPFRIVKLVNIKIKNNGKLLFEIEQKLRNNKIRYRNSLPSEKIKTHEDSVKAALRGLDEELGISREDIDSIHPIPGVRYSTRKSLSYPNLLSKYIIYCVEVNTNKLPNRDFWTTESNLNKENLVKEHKWKWKKI